MNRFIRVLHLLAWLGLNPLLADDPRPCVLELRNGDFVRGHLEDASEGIISWRSEHFSVPLRFDISRVEAMKFAPTEIRPDPEGDFLIELNNRDALSGNVLAIHDQGVEFESPHFGMTVFRPGTVKRISRRGPAMKVYPVPTRLSGWTQSENGLWRSEGNSFITDSPLASLYADVELPDRAVIELEFAWAKTKSSTKAPSFSIYLGTESSADARKKAFSVEVWDEFSVVQRQTDDDADLASLGTSRDKGSMHVFAYLDQQAGQLLLYDVGGKLLADLNVPAAGAKGPGIMFLNRRGQFRLNYVQVRGWSGAKPSTQQQHAVQIAAADEVFGGRSVTLTDGVLTIEPNEDAKASGKDLGSSDPPQIPLEQVKQIDFSVADLVGDDQIVAGFQDGSRISGELTSADETHLHVQSRLSQQPLKLPISALRGFAIQHMNSEATYPRSSPTGFRFGKLELMDTRLHGWLIEREVPAGQQGSCLTWQPAVAENASPLVATAYGRIVYREPPAPVKRPKPRNQNQPGVVFLGGIARPTAAVAKKPRVAKTRSSRAVHLRSGDVIPGSVTKIDEAGVHIESTSTEAKFLRHDQVKAAQLIDNAPTPLLSASKRQRLLTLPRMQRNAPPTHLLFSNKGDVLRGSVVSLNENELLMEVRLNPRPIPRDRVATVVWLHEDEMEGDDSATAPASDSDEKQPGEKLMIQVVRNTGTRFSFHAESFHDQTIHGFSEILQSMRAKVSDIDQLLLGGFIKSNAKTLAFGRWHLTAATDPKYITADAESTGDGSTTPGTESLLVGKVAPELQLKMLDETTSFRLSDHRGHCVVLDFWATWCGPCLQVMPIVERVVGEFEDKQVKLFAVNLEERPAEIKATLERRELDVPVVLDRDGVAAARYEATAIPQTVVIGLDGKVARVFIGSSRHFEDELRAAIAELVN